MNKKIIYLNILLFVVLFLINSCQDYKGIEIKKMNIIDENENIPTEKPCHEIWKCGGWDDCINGQQKRICTDKNECDIKLTRPIETQSCGSSLCKPLYTNHNSISNNRINFIFEGIKFENITEFLIITKNFIDLNSIADAPGLFGQEPFKSNKNLFNFWYIDEINDCDNVSNTECNNKAKLNYDLCNFSNKYYFRFFDNAALTKWVPYLGVSNQNNLWIWAFEPRPFDEPLIDSRNYNVHEFGHAFNSKKMSSAYAPLLLDEYGGSTKYLNYNYVLREGPYAGKILPNVWLENNLSTIEDCKQNAPWSDLIGNGCGESGVIDCILNYTHPQISPRVYESIECKSDHPDCYKEISCFEGSLGFEKGVFRSSYDSIMNNKQQLISGFNLPSQRYLCSIIKAEIGVCSGICNNFISCQGYKKYAVVN